MAGLKIYTDAGWVDVGETAASILAKLLTVDGAGSLLDADLLDGLHASAFQPNDATLTSISALGTAADKMIYTTGVDTWAETAITADARLLLADADVPRLGTANTWTGAQTVKIADGTDVIILKDDSGIEWLKIKRSGATVTIDVPSVEPTNKLLNPTFDSDLIGWSEVPSYILNDQFTTDRAAGAVNGTSAEPTGGTRTVVDTNSKLSITGGQASFATGGSAIGDPSLWYTLITRGAGKVLVVDSIPTTKRTSFGFDVNTATAIRDGFTYGINSSSSLEINADGATISVGTFTAGSQYKLAVIMRGTGMYYYVKGGTEYPNWTLVYISAVGSAGGYPALGAYDAASVGTFDNLRIPTSTWLPTPLVYDTFTRADGAIGNTEDDSPDGTTLPAHAAPVLAWTNQVGTVAIASNKAIATALGGDRAICTFPSGSADVLHSAALIRGTTGVGIVLRYVDSSNYVYAKRIATNVVIIKRIAGSETTLATVAVTEVSSAVLLGIFYGTKFRPYYNNAMLGSELTISDIGIQAEDQMGLIFFDTDSTADLVMTYDRDGYTDAPFEEGTATRDTTTKYEGAASVKLVAGGTNFNYLQSLNVGDTAAYTLLCYAYTDGSAVVAADLELYYDADVLSTTFTSMGGGWYRLTGTLTGVASAKDYGVRVKAGKTAYCDSFLLQAGSGETVILKILNSGTGLSLLQLGDGLPEYADNAAAVAAGLAVGTLYRTGDATKVVH